MESETAKEEVSAKVQPKAGASLRSDHPNRCSFGIAIGVHFDKNPQRAGSDGAKSLQVKRIPPHLSTQVYNTGPIQTQNLLVMKDL